MKNILRWFKRKPKDGRAKLSETDVRAIRIMIHSGDSQAKVARHFNVSRANVHLIVHGKIWRKV